MKASSAFSLLSFFLSAGTVQGETTSPSPTVQFLYNANITVGLPVDVGAIPAGNVTVIPVIGGALLGPKISGLSLSYSIFWPESSRSVQERCSPLEPTGACRPKGSTTPTCEHRFARSTTQTSTSRCRGSSRETMEAYMCAPPSKRVIRIIGGLTTPLLLGQ